MKADPSLKMSKVAFSNGFLKNVYKSMISKVIRGSNY